MKKLCEICETEFITKEGKQKTCGNRDCSNELRRQWNNKKKLIGIQVPKPTFTSPGDLPPVEVLPAVYLKQCADYWLGLVGEEEKGTRIA